ncbi:hypothetical protein GWK47_054924 [Chionoecetes opilio]|uniref:Uncharacterized protein n=1 Tax=Chionoecetes opilio TaxID=41210 RepID=A0A8J4Y5N2_CHIOP|nr:hypothetical protein GWK47_054924 [Chionoecetes opilio]
MFARRHTFKTFSAVEAAAAKRTYFWILWWNKNTWRTSPLDGRRFSGNDDVGDFSSSHTTSELFIVLIVDIHCSVVCLIAVTRDIGMICCTLSDVEWIGTGSTTTAGAEHRAWKLAPHTATFPTSTCSLRCAATSDQLENVLRGVGYTVLHISRDETLVSVHQLPTRVSTAARVGGSHSGHCTGERLGGVLYERSAQTLLCWGKLHSFGAAVDLPVFCAHSFWRILVIEEVGVVMP